MADKCPPVLGPHDPKVINLNHQWEIDYWTRELGVTEVELQAAVRTVGSATEAPTEHVRRHLMGARAGQVAD